MPEAPAQPASAASEAETTTVRQIVAQLDSMPADRARFLAGFAYVLGRVAEADFTISDIETREMERIVVEHGHIPEAQAVIVVQIAKTQARLFGPTEDYLVTREFRAGSTDAERLDLLRCCYLIGAVDGGITAEEAGTLAGIAEELDVDAAALSALRAEFAEQLTAIQAMRVMRAKAAPRADGEA
jgi:uncharacterized tellurite resistance protein B-like protein